MCLAAGVTLAQEFPPLTGRVVDAADIIAPEEEQALAALLAAGQHVDPGTVKAIMAAQGLVAAQPRRSGPKTTIPARDLAQVPDLVQRDFTATEPGVKLVGDITYIRTWEGWVYLAVVLDCYSKKVLGWAMADHMRADLVIEAMAMAARNGHVRYGVSIFHSDRGSQYTSEAYRVFCYSRGITRSMGRTGVCWDNAYAESWNGTLKNERVNRRVYPTREKAIQDVAHWIELRYNHKRLHSALGYATPNQFHESFDAGQVSAQKQGSQSEKNPSAHTSPCAGSRC